MRTRFLKSTRFARAMALLSPISPLPLIVVTASACGGRIRHDPHGFAAGPEEAPTESPTGFGAPPPFDPPPPPPPERPGTAADAGDDADAHVDDSDADAADADVADAGDP